MTVSPTPPPAPVAPAPSFWKRATKKVVTAVLWARSAEGRRDIGAAIAAVTAIYTALHRAGV